MTSRRSALQDERVRLFLRIILASAGIGAAIGPLLAPADATPAVSVLLGVANGVLIAAGIAGFAIFVLREGSSSNRLAHLPFLAAFLLKTLVYGAIVAAVVLGAHLLSAQLLPGRAASLDRHSALVIIGAALAITVLFVIVLQASSLLGRRTFRDLVLGRYWQPRAERRFFLFVDVVGSTAIAERLGPLEAHRFLAAVFSATAEPVAACRGEIYQYVGDEIVVTWTEAEGRPGARPLHCYFEMQDALARRDAEFHARFGARPGLRAALHLGEVIAGEVGEQRRAIVYHGDVMNTAARLEQATRELGCSFIASAAAVEALLRPPELAYRDLGELVLRGRKKSIAAWAVEKV
jgi:adenylate cyclase